MAVRGPVIVLTGPTGTGKTDWALRLAEDLPVEIVSVDSALVYRGLDIGTAKPPRELRDARPASPHRHLRPDGELLRRTFRRRMPYGSISRNRSRAAGFRCWSAAPCSIFARCWRGIAPLPRASPELR